MTIQPAAGSCAEKPRTPNLSGRRGWRVPTPRAMLWNPRGCSGSAAARKGARARAGATWATVTCRTGVLRERQPPHAGRAEAERTRGCERPQQRPQAGRTAATAAAAAPSAPATAAVAALAAARQMGSQPLPPHQKQAACRATAVRRPGAAPQPASDCEAAAAGRPHGAQLQPRRHLPAR